MSSSLRNKNVNGLRVTESLRDWAALRGSFSFKRGNCSGSCVALRQPTVDIEVINTTWAQRDTVSGLLCRCQQTRPHAGVLMQAELFSSFQYQR